MMPGRGERVLVAMSGGVDSSVAALLLHEAGHEVIGLSMRLVTEQLDTQGCCSATDFADARRIADQIGIPYYVLDFREPFRERVIDTFVSEYTRGRTPNPCLLCNRDVRFPFLWRKARELGAGWLATGHYARILPSGGDLTLRRARDRTKDQSYFLFALSQADLAHTLFPVGALTKGEVRAKARAAGLRVADKDESQEVCFVGPGGYVPFLESRLVAGERRPGLVVDEAGRALGCHEGIHRFTVGQRRGLGVATGQALYVSAIDAARGMVTVVPRHRLGATGCRVRGASWVVDKPARQRTAEVKVRYRSVPVPAEIEPGADGEVRVSFLPPGPAVTPGQAAVFYDGDEVLGGGWIAGPLTD